MYVQVRHTRRWPYWLVIILLAFLLLASVLAHTMTLATLGNVFHARAHFHEGGEDEFPQFEEAHSYGFGSNKVVRIAFSGFITRQMEYGFFGISSNPTENVIRQIRAARQDLKVQAIIFEVDSPGGEITAADEIYHELMLFKESAPERKIVALVHDMAASGGYYISVPADHIVAQPTAIIGSIGVIMQSLNIKALSDKIGVTDTTIKSGKNKDMLNPFREVDPDQVALLQSSVDSMYEHFLHIVSTNRNLSLDDLRPLADGRIFTVSEALNAHLIDEIGYWETAVDGTKRLLEADDLYVVTYQRSKGFMESFFGVQAPTFSPQGLFSIMAPRRLFFWQP